MAIASNDGLGPPPIEWTLWEIESKTKADYIEKCALMTIDTNFKEISGLDYYEGIEDSLHSVISFMLMEANEYSLFSCLIDAQGWNEIVCLSGNPVLYCKNIFFNEVFKQKDIDEFTHRRITIIIKIYQTKN